VGAGTGGESEALIGKWFARSGKRDKVVLATKVAKWAERPGLTGQHQCRGRGFAAPPADRRDRSVQAHEDDESTPLEATLAAFGRLIEAGKVRAIGASNYSATRLADALKVSADYKLPHETLQPEYNLYDRAGYEGTGTAGAARTDRRDRLLRAGQWLPQRQVPHAGRCGQEPGAWRERGEALSEPARPAHPAGAG
jgi:aryl-alcohol dehydrogenase-like predicted oxidoreductase